MRKFKTAMIALFALVIVSNVCAQDSNNPWAISFGFNAIDLNPNSTSGNNLEDYVGFQYDWNILPSISRISVEKYINNGFTLQLAGSMNKLDKKVNDLYKKGNELYFAIDANVKYDVNKLIDYTFGSTSKLFDPYVYLGLGHTSIDKVGETML